MEEAWNLRFSVDRSMRYHARRRAFYDWMHKLAMLSIIVLGSAAVARYDAQIAGFLVAVVGALDLVFAPSVKAREHDFLRRRFSDLMSQIVTCAQPTQETLNKWKTERLAIESDEPPIYWAVEASCYNETSEAYGKHQEAHVKLRWYHLLLMNVWRFEEGHFPFDTPASSEDAHSVTR